MSRIKDNKSHFQYSQADVDATAFGQRLRVSAERRGYSAADLGRLAEITKQSMSAYWNGSRLCGVDRLFVLADILGIDARWLATGESHAQTPDAQLLERLRALDAPARAVMLDLADLIARSRR